ncbi:pseudouridine synthase [Salinimicrobium sp. GXAS 041]|uniref:RluA family pseudouridine synthase n=1 Tax=Salinimicrobium sp. GXAS 041 TaxID=3400806 RepID=UPI003C7596E4
MTFFTETHKVPNEISPIRLQEYGVGIFDACSTKSALKKALKRQHIQVNGKIATSATIIDGGEKISLYIPEEQKTLKKLIFPLQVLFEDEHLALIHKPAGILVNGNRFKTIANALPQKLKQSNLFDATRPQPVHRLDYATTGILMIGKTRSSIRLLNGMFEEKKIQKIYYAVSIGEMNDFGKINSEIGGKPSETIYSVCNSVPSERFTRLNLVQLKPKTGRRHQLRKHLSGIGNPILGDKKYGTEGLILNGKGLYLHAFSLEFEHPFTGEKVKIEDGLPKKFSKIFSRKEES